MSEKARIAANAGWLLIYQVSNFASQLIVTPFLVRVLDKAAFGAFITVLASIQFAYVITDYGFSLSATYAISSSRGNKLAIQEIIGTVHAAKLPLVVVSSLVLVAATFVPALAIYKSMFLLAVPIVFLQAYQPVWFFLGTENMRQYAIVMVWTKVVYVGAVFLIVDGPAAGVLVVLCLLLGNVIGTWLGLRKMNQAGFNALRIKFSGSLSCMRTSTNYFWSRLAVSLYTSVNSMILGYSSLPQAAIYGAAEQIYKAGQSVTGPINQALFPYMARTRRASELLYITTGLAVILSVGCVLVWTQSDWIISLVYGDAYLGAGPVLAVFLILVVVSYLNVSIGYPLFSALGHPEFANYSVIGASAVYLLAISYSYVHSSITAMSVVYCVAATEVSLLVLRLSSWSWLRKIEKQGSGRKA